MKRDDVYSTAANALSLTLSHPVVAVFERRVEDRFATRGPRGATMGGGRGGAAETRFHTRNGKTREDTTRVGKSENEEEKEGKRRRPCKR